MIDALGAREGLRTMRCATMRAEPYDTAEPTMTLPFESLRVNSAQDKLRTMRACATMTLPFESLRVNSAQDKLRTRTTTDPDGVVFIVNRVVTIGNPRGGGQMGVIAPWSGATVCCASA